MTKACHLLLIEDDPWLRAGLEHFLTAKLFRVSAVDTLSAARALLTSETDPVQLIISDVSLPDGQALTLFDELHLQDKIGKIFISSSITEQDRIAGLQTGADDYLCKPIFPEELLLRIKAILRRLNLNTEPESDIRFLHYALNPESRVLSFADKQVQLGQAEHQLLLQLIARQGKIVSRAMLFNCLDNAETYQQGRALDILVSRLRKKMQGDNPSDNPIITYRGKGYMLVVQH